MRVERIFCAGGIFVIFAAISLFSLAGNVGAQCTPGQRDNYLYVPPNIEQPWIGSHVPSSILPEGFLGPTGYYASSMSDRCGWGNTRGYSLVWVLLLPICSLEPINKRIW